MSARAEAMGARVDEASQWKNPELRVSAVQLDEILLDKPKVDLKLRISPARPGEIDAEVAIARAEEGAARAEAKASELAAEAEARWMFKNVLLFDAEIEAADEEASGRAKLTLAIKARADRAQATRVDEALAMLENEKASQEGAALRAERSAALGSLLDILGVAGSADVKLLGAALDPATLPDLPSEDALVEAALAARPEPAVAAARIDATHAAAYIERAKQWPWLSFVELGYDFEPGVRRGLGFAFGAGLEVPLFSVNSGGVLRADADTKEARAALEAAVERVASEVRARLREARAALDVARSFRGSTDPAAARAAEAVNAALDAGQSDLLRVALVEEKRSAVRREQLKLVRRYHEAMAALRSAVGGRMPEAPPTASAKEPSK